MTVQMVRVTASEANVADIETAIEAMIAEIHEAQPIGTRFRVVQARRRCDVPQRAGARRRRGKPPVRNPRVPGVPTTAPEPGRRVAESPTPQAVTVVGSYQLFE